MVEDSLYSLHLIDEYVDILGRDGRPLPDLGQVLVLGGDVALDLLFHIVYGGKVPSSEDVLAQYAQPDVDRVEPAAVLGRGDDADTMFRITERRLSRLHALEYAPHSLFPSDVIVTKRVSNEAPQRLALMSGELITHHDEACGGIELDQSRHVFNTVRFGSGISNRWSEEGARSKMKGASQYLGAMTFIMELPTFHVA